MFCKRQSLCLDGGGPLDIPAVDEGKDGDAEDGKQLDGLVGRTALGEVILTMRIALLSIPALGEEWLERVDGEGEGNDGNGGRHDDDALNPHPEDENQLWSTGSAVLNLMNAGNLPRATMM